MKSNVKSKQLKKTIETLSKMAEDTSSGNTSHNENRTQVRFGGTKNFRLSDLNISSQNKGSESASSCSIYSGAELKLEAFDYFQNSLNKCGCDHNFSIQDTAIILKQMTPNIIYKVISLLSQNDEQMPTINTQSSIQLGANKTTVIDQNISDGIEMTEDGEGAVDLEVSEINNGNKTAKGSFLKTKNTIKRPDASRPTRMLSPGSNSCSPVSAAVQALISISAPITQTKNTIIEKTSKGFIKTSKAPIVQNEKKLSGFVPVPVSKAVISISSDNLFLPVHKPEVIFSKSDVSTTENATEVPEVLMIQKKNFPNSIQINENSSSYSNISTQNINKLCTVQTADLSSQTFHKPQNTNNIKLNMNSVDATLQSNSLSQDDPLPQFSLLLNTPGLSVDMNCGLPSPFAQVLPGSPMSTTSVIHQSPQHPQSQQQMNNQQLHQQLSQESPTIPMPISINSLVSSMSIPLTSSTQTEVAANFTMIPSVNIEQSSLIDSTVQNFVVSEDNPNRNGNQLRPILPKTINASSSVNLGNCLLSTVTTSNMQPVENNKLEKLSVSSIPPNQMFTSKVQQQLGLGISQLPVNRTNFSNQMHPSPFINNDNLHVIHQQLLQQHQEKNQQQQISSQLEDDEQQYQDTQMQHDGGEDTMKSEQVDLVNACVQQQKDLDENSNSSVNRTVVITKENDLQMIVDKAILDNITGNRSQQMKGPENSGGQLEVASALLSMGTESESTAEDQKALKQDIRLEDLMEYSNQSDENTGIVLNEDGTIIVGDVEVDPKRHSIRKDNFTCGKCSKVFTSLTYLAKHIKRVCPDMSHRKWKCDKCSKAFRHPFGLNQHTLTHTGVRPHKCGQCSKAFYSANDLRRHERTHSGEKPYECEVCGKRFSTTISLKTHSYVHSGERPHKCPNCPKSFATSSKLNRHVVTHLENRPYACEICPKTFNRSGDLRKHLTQHYGKTHELLACDHCNKKFATNTALKKHKSTHKTDNKQVMLLVG